MLKHGTLKHHKLPPKLINNEIIYEQENISLVFKLDIVFIYFFFSSRRRHTRYWRDWSSDVCSSDLTKSHCPMKLSALRGRRCLRAEIGRASVGKSVDLGGRRIIKKKKKKK